uniref:NYD-SP28_assoc domain-containing protein n=1 Tax=Glossina pallidipes TaxID=7398 RepID=A0A1B0AGA4_GLOPL
MCALNVVVIGDGTWIEHYVSIGMNSNLFDAEMSYERTRNACEQDDSELNLLQWNKEEIENYWHKFDYYLAKDKQNVWKTIENALNHYLEVLKKREQIDQRVRKKLRTNGIPAEN